MAEHPARKFKAAKPISQKVGPTFDKNDPAKFVNHGKFSGKTPANGVEDHMKGPTFTCNETHIPTMNADKPAKESKVIKESKAPEYADKVETAGKLTASQAGSGGPTDKPYPLKKEYRKRG